MRKLKFLVLLLVLPVLLISCVSRSLPESTGEKEDETEASADNTITENNDINTDGDIAQEEDAEEQNPEKPEKDSQDTNKNSSSKTEKNESFSLNGRWIIKPNFLFDGLETFGLTGYSIYKKGDRYGIIDISGKQVGEGTYSNLFYCPSHGLSSSDISGEPVKLRNDLSLSPDCGYEKDGASDITYVFDNTRDRVYAAGMSGGVFRLVDITDTDYFKTNDRYIVALYDCDADIMMYDGIGMRSIGEIFKAESKEMHYGVIDTDLDYVIACIYDEVLYGNDCYIVKKDGKYGYRAITGKEYYPCVFEYANTAYKGAAWVKYGGKWGTVRF